MAAADRGAHWRIIAKQVPAERLVEVTLPPDALATKGQRDFREWLRRAYPGVVVIRERAVRPTPRACSYPYCDPPLRAGIRIASSGYSCTGSFLARSRVDAKLYQLTAGHCGEASGDVWDTRFADAGVHDIGDVHNHRFDSGTDSAILHVANPPGWRARAWVQVTDGAGTTANSEYPIRAEGESSVGMRVCTTGSWFGASNCGVVDGVNVLVDYGEAIVGDMVSSTLCTTSGDSGGPVFARNTAYGLISGGGLPCETFYEPIITAENAMRVNVSHDAG